MIVIDGTKYACELCIRGHRSSNCIHRDRPLIKIRKKGRPSTTCVHCKELRKSKNVNPSGTCQCAKLGSHGAALLSCNCQIGDVCRCHARRGGGGGDSGRRSAASSAVSTPMMYHNGEEGEYTYNNGDGLSKEIASLLSEPDQDLSYLFDNNHTPSYAYMQGDPSLVVTSPAVTNVGMPNEEPVMQQPDNTVQFGKGIPQLPQLPQQQVGDNNTGLDISSFFTTGIPEFPANDNDNIDFRNGLYVGNPNIGIDNGANTNANANTTTTTTTTTNNNNNNNLLDSIMPEESLLDGDWSVQKYSLNMGEEELQRRKHQ